MRGSRTTVTVAGTVERGGGRTRAVLVIVMEMELAGSTETPPALRSTRPPAAIEAELVSERSAA